LRGRLLSCDASLVTSAVVALLLPVVLIDEEPCGSPLSFSGNVAEADADVDAEVDAKVEVELDTVSNRPDSNFKVEFEPERLESRSDSMGLPPSPLLLNTAAAAAVAEALLSRMLDSDVDNEESESLGLGWIMTKFSVPSETKTSAVVPLSSSSTLPSCSVTEMIDESIVSEIKIIGIEPP